MEKSELPHIRIEPDPSEDPSRPPPIPAWMKWLAAYAAVVVPLGAFAVTAFIVEERIADIPWWADLSPRNGPPGWILLRGASLIWFLPFWLYAGVSFCLVLYDEAQTARLPVVRFGVYTGALLSVNFTGLYLVIAIGMDLRDWIQFFIAMAIPSFIAFPFLFFLYTGIQKQIFDPRKKFPRRGKRNLFLWKTRWFAVKVLWKYFPHAVVVLAGTFLCLLMLGGMPLLTEVAKITAAAFLGVTIFSLIFVVGVTLGLGPLLMVIVYGLMGRRLWHYYGEYGDRFQFSLRGLFWSITWLAVYLAAWHAAVAQMLRFSG